jgi:hypothetical protein
MSRLLLQIVGTILGKSALDMVEFRMVTWGRRLARLAEKLYPTGSELGWMESIETAALDAERGGLPKVQVLLSGLGLVLIGGPRCVIGSRWRAGPRLLKPVLLLVGMGSLFLGLQMSALLIPSTARESTSLNQLRAYYVEELHTVNKAPAVISKLPPNLDAREAKTVKWMKREVPVARRFLHKEILQTNGQRTEARREFTDDWMVTAAFLLGGFFALAAVLARTRRWIFSNVAVCSLLQAGVGAALLLKGSTAVGVEFGWGTSVTGVLTLLTLGAFIRFDQLDQRLSRLISAAYQAG